MELSSEAQLNTLFEKLVSPAAHEVLQADNLNAVTTALMANLTSANAEVKRLSLTCLRLLLRDLTAAKPLYSSEHIEAFMRAADLSQYGAHADVSLEAIKCIVNFAIRAMEIERSKGNDVQESLVLKALRASEWPTLAVRWLRNAAASSKDNEEVFALCKLVNMMLLDTQIKEQLSNAELVDLLLDVLKHSVNTLAQGENSPLDGNRFNIAGDCMRIFFHLSSEFGPLSSQANAAGTAYPITTESGKLEEELRRQKPVPAHVATLFTQSIEPLKTALLFDFHDPRKAALQLACVMFALNLPKEQILQFDAFKTLPQLIEICRFHLEAQDASACTNMLMLFTKIARDEPKTRGLFMQTMFPRWKEIFESADNDGVQMPSQHRDTMGKLVIDCMQSINTGLHFYANEFVFLLCNENAGAFTRFVGFGPAAGHLAVRGLMNFGGGVNQHNNNRAELDQRASAENTAASGSLGASIPKATNWQERSIPEPDLSNVSEEDLREWNDLVEKMNRLDELGVIRMVGRADQGDHNAAPGEKQDEEEQRKQQQQQGANNNNEKK